MTAPSLPDPLGANGVIAVIRASEPIALRTVATALAAGGIGAIEITLTTPGALGTIRDLAIAGLPNCWIGAGSVLDERAAVTAIEAGARFVVSPVTDPSVLRACRERQVPCLPGALTPTEILAAWKVGVELVKVFPSGALGPGYFRDLLAPMPFLRLVPSGGVTLENAEEWIRAGAAAISVGSALVPRALLREESATELTSRARLLVERVAAARRERAGAGT